MFALNLTLPCLSLNNMTKEQLFNNAIETLELVKKNYIPQQVSKVYNSEVSSYAFDSKELTLKNISAFKCDVDDILVDVLQQAEPEDFRLLLFERFLPVLVTYGKLKVTSVLRRFYHTDINLHRHVKRKFEKLNANSWGNKEANERSLQVYFEACFKGKEDFSGSYEEMVKILIRFQKCNLQEIRQFVAKTKLSSKHKPSLLEKIASKLPTTFLSGREGWNVSSLLALLFIALDIGSDVQLTHAYYNWNENIKSYGVGNLSTSDYIKCQNINCKVFQLHKKLPFAYSLSILLLMEFLQLLYLYKGHSGKIVSAMNMFFLGKYSVSKGNFCRRFSRLIFEIISGILLPFAIGMYKFILDIQAVQLSIDHEKRKALDIQTSKRCKTCKDLRGLEPCVICGYGCKFTDKGYSEEIKKRQSKVSKWNGNVKLLMATVEDTYMPILQFYLLIPLVIKHLQSGRQFYIGLSGNPLFMYSLYSIISSILNMASMRTTIYFSRDSKEGLGERLVTRILFQFSSILMICGRILTLEIFGLTCLPSHLAPLWLALFCLAHCFFVLVIKSTLIFIKIKNGVDVRLRKGIKRNVLFSSFASVFTFSKEVTMEKASPRDYKFSFLDRSCFTLLLLVEQVAMTIAIIKFNKSVDVNITLLLQVLWIILFLGFFFDWVVLIFCNPWAPLRYMYEWKKRAMSSILSLVVFAGTFVFLYVVRQSRMPVVSILVVSLPFIILVKWRAQFVEKETGYTKISEKNDFCKDRRRDDKKSNVNTKGNNDSSDHEDVTLSNDMDEKNYFLTTMI